MKNSGLRLVALLMLPGLANAASFEPLGGGSFSIANAVSGDGSVVVGNQGEAFRWTSGSGMVLLGRLPHGGASYGYGVSADGAVVVGDSEVIGGYEAFRWTSSDGMVGLGGLAGGTHSSAYGVSADGSAVVGSGYLPFVSGQDPIQQAFRWTSADGMVGLGYLPGGDVGSIATGISTDGAVAVGYSGSDLGPQAFRWTSGDGMVGLGDLPDGTFDSFASGVSSNGEFVVGVGHGASGREAFRWTSGGGMVGLSDLAGGSFDSSAQSVSADGNIVVGYATTDLGSEAFVWTSGGGMERLFDVLVSNGASGLDGWILKGANSISADGTWVVGFGRNPNGQLEAFRANIATVPAPPAIWLLSTAVAGLGWLRRTLSAR